MRLMAINVLMLMMLGVQSARLLQKFIKICIIESRLLDIIKIIISSLQ